MVLNNFKRNVYLLNLELEDSEMIIPAFYKVTPLIHKYLKQEEDKKQTVKVVLPTRIISSLKHLEFVRIKLGKIGDKLISTPLNRGAGTRVLFNYKNYIIRLFNITNFIINHNMYYKY